MNARRMLACLLGMSAVILAAHSSDTLAREPLILPTVMKTFSAPFESVWDAVLKSLGSGPPALVDKPGGHIESDPFFFYFPFGAEASQGILVSLAITAHRVDAHHTTVQVQPRMHFMLYDGVLPGPTNNPWADLFTRIGRNLGASEQERAVGPNIGRRSHTRTSRVGCVTLGYASAAWPAGAL